MESNKRISEQFSCESEAVETANLTLHFKGVTRDPTRLRSGRWRGFELENVSLESSEPYSFVGEGQTHYLALHDLALIDGELEIDGLPTIRQRELQGTLTFAPQGAAIRGWAKPAVRRNAYTALYFDPLALGIEVGDRYIARDPCPFAYARDPSLAATMGKLKTLVEGPEVDDLYAETLCLAAALEILAIIPRSDAGRLTERQVQVVREFVEANLALPISLDDLAGLVQLSRSHFSRAFKATIGTGPHNYVAQRRITKARELLRNEALSVEAIGLAVGYRSAAAFRRVFSRATGVAPQAFRAARR